MVEPTTFAAFLAAVTAGAAARAVVPPRHRLASRLRPYAALGRSRLGVGYADVSVAALVSANDRSTFSRVFGPTLVRVAAQIARQFDAEGHARLELRLRQAGRGHLDVMQYRIRQFGWTVGGDHAWRSPRGRSARFG